MTVSRFGPLRPLLGLGLLFGLMIALVAGERAMGLTFILPVHIGVLAAFLAAALWLTHHYWRAIDEAARAAQKTAWFWGGSLAMIPGIVLLVVLGAPRVGFSDWLLTQAPHVNLLVVGGMIMAVVQVAGFLLAWAIWWAGKR